MASPDVSGSGPDISPTTGRFETIEEAMQHARWALDRAHRQESKISLDPKDESNQLLRLHGMSGYKYRHLLNNLCSREGITYAEVGTWKGSTFLSATYHNRNIRALTCDNWSEFGGPKDEFMTNYTASSSWPGNAEAWQTCSHGLIDQDFRSVNMRGIAPIDIYFYDGPHSRKDQCDGILAAWDALAENCILLVDDWNWRKPRAGTWDALKAKDADIRMHSEIFTSAEGWVSLKQGEQHTTRFESSKWHNGVAIFVISKKKAIMEGTADFVQVAKVSEIPKEDLEQFKHMMKPE
jgi:hypothetical protein